MKQFAEVKDVNHDDMVLFHQNDCHFNLVVSSKSDLATLGNLSHRFNIGPFLETKDSHDDNNIDKQTEVLAPMLESEMFSSSRGYFSI